MNSTYVFLNDQAFTEKHYRIAELAELWGIGMRDSAQDRQG